MNMIPPAPVSIKPFSWSYSKLKNFETCRKRHYEVDIAKRVVEEESDNLTWGNDVHKAMELRIGRGAQLPMGMGHYERWAVKVAAMPGQKLVELKLAITRELGPCGYFDKDAWWRGKVDVAVVNGVVAWAGDWKTGKILDEPVQLGLTAAAMFAHNPALAAVKCNYIWLKDNVAGNDEIYRREDMPGFWAKLLPRVQAMEHAYNTTTYPADPGRLCRNWCPVKTCPHWGQ